MALKESACMCTTMLLLSFPSFLLISSPSFPLAVVVSGIHRLQRIPSAPLIPVGPGCHAHTTPQQKNSFWVETFFAVISSSSPNWEIKSIGKTLLGHDERAAELGVSMIAQQLVPKGRRLESQNKRGQVALAMSSQDTFRGSI